MAIRALTGFAFIVAERYPKSSHDAVDVIEVADALGQIKNRPIVKPGITQRLDIILRHLLRCGRELPRVQHKGFLTVGEEFQAAFLQLLGSIMTVRR